MLSWMFHKSRGAQPCNKNVLYFHNGMDLQPYNKNALLDNLNTVLGLCVWAGAWRVLKIAVLLFKDKKYFNLPFS